MIVSGNVIAQKLLDDGVEVDDNVSCTLPSIEHEAADMKGAGILGTINMPSTGQINSMVFSISLKSINKNASSLARPGTHNLELRFAKDFTSSNGQMIPQGSKIFITGIQKKFDPGKVEISATMDGSADFEVIRYRQVIDGAETILIDKKNYIYKVNGVDYMAAVKAILG
ncbi:phage major tail tube protein [Desulfosporosinus sp. OT]|uniref:phage major tail tube protein n=1 Tax=Desulfosporosinus sp. OT TaxID=913865 RepID=UPI000223A5D5|nr:phage major tail tube protein [Desulfosporosinus sp. OT]EGW39162.1 hypothetical protein DOT_2895 [Desulfosporosinus sp. OT]